MPRRPQLGLAGQMDLLNWQPAAPAVAFDEREVRAASVATRIARGIGAALRACGQTREQVAERMGVYLGKPVSRAMLDAYASEAREEHVISVPRFLALLHATRDRRLLELLAEPCGGAVVERRHLALITAAQLREREDELRREREALMRRARSEGAA